MTISSTKYNVNDPLIKDGVGVKVVGEKIAAGYADKFMMCLQ